MSGGPSDVMNCGFSAFPLDCVAGFSLQVGTHKDFKHLYNSDCKRRGSEISSSIGLRFRWQCKHGKTVLVTGNL